MMVRNLLLSTVLTAVVSLGSIASADEVKREITIKKTTSKTARKVKDDVYSLKLHHPQHKNAHHAHEVAKKKEELIVFADIKQPVQEIKKQDALINSDGLAVKVGGKVDIQLGTIDQKSDFKNPADHGNLPQSNNADSYHFMNTYGSAVSNQSAMVSNGEVRFTAEKGVEGDKYGLDITANANTSPAASGNPNFASKVYIFAENNAGRFELGANDGASEAMAVSGASIAKATGGIDGDYTDWIGYGAVATAATEYPNLVLDETFLTSPSLPYAAQNSKKANKVTYYTPTVNGLKAGLSFVPDVTVQGTTYEALQYIYGGYKNVFEGGLSYEQKANNFAFKVAATGQTGEARDAMVKYRSDAGIANSTQKLKRLNAWQVGGEVSFDALSLAASYGDWATSGTLRDSLSGASSRKANFWTAGVAFDHQDKGGVSLTYLNSTRRGAFTPDSYYYTANTTTGNAVTGTNAADFYEADNKYEAISLGAEYKVMPGLMPYAELTSFKYKSSSSKIKTNSGSVILSGVKLNF